MPPKKDFRILVVARPGSGLGNSKDTPPGIFICTPSELPALRPPTMQDIVNYRAFLIDQDSEYGRSNTKLFSRMTADIMEKWKMVSPNLELKSVEKVIDNIRKFIFKLRDANPKQFKGRNGEMSLKCLVDRLNQVMDITDCKCGLSERVDCDDKNCQTYCTLTRGPKVVDNTTEGRVGT